MSMKTLGFTIYSGCFEVSIFLETLFPFFIDLTASNICGLEATLEQFEQTRIFCKNKCFQTSVYNRFLNRCWNHLLEQAFQSFSVQWHQKNLNDAAWCQRRPKEANGCRRRPNRFFLFEYIYIYIYIYMYIYIYIASVCLFLLSGSSTPLRPTC